MSLHINFEAEKDDAFHSHGFAKVAYGANLGSASPVPGGGRAGAGDVGAVGTYRYADVSHRHKREAGPDKNADENPRGKLHVEERNVGKDQDSAAFSHRDASEPTIRTFREPPGRSYNPYS